MWRSWREDEMKSVKLLRPSSRQVVFRGSGACTHSSMANHPIRTRAAHTDGTPLLADPQRHAERHSGRVACTFHMCAALQAQAATQQARAHLRWSMWTKPLAAEVWMVPTRACIRFKLMPPPMTCEWRR